MKIEELSDKRQIKEELIRENAKFNMESIFIEEVYEGAMILITPKQTVKSYVDKSHERIAKLMYQALYGERLEANDDEMWQQVLADQDIICIQLCRDGFQIMFLPKKISTKQYNMMQETIGQFDKINTKLEERGKAPLNYMLAITKENGEVQDGIMSLNEIMKRSADITTNEIKSRKKEEILGVNKNRIGSLARSARHYRKGAEGTLREITERNKAGIMDR